MQFPADEMPIEALAWILCTLADGTKIAEQSSAAAIVRYLTNCIDVVESEGAGYCYSYYDTMTRHKLFHSSTRTDAVLLMSLVLADPKNVLIPKLVKGLLLRRKTGTGAWDNTQENCWSILALYRYFQEFEKEKPNAELNIWINEEFTGAIEMKGHSMNSKSVEYPLSYVFANAKNVESGAGAGGNAVSEVVMAKDGPGRIYYRVAMKAVPSDLLIDGMSNGFTVTRTYFNENGKEIPRESAYTLKLTKGEIYTVKVEIVLIFSC